MNEEQLVDAAYAFVTDPRASRTGRALVEEWPGIIPVLESMVLDGVEDRRDVVDYIHDVLHPSALALQDER